MIKLQRNGLVTIPKHLRDELGWKEDDWLQAVLEDGRIVLENITLRLKEQTL